MKSLFILLTIAASFFATSSHAADETGTAAEKAFKNTFSQAQDVSWTISEQYSKVSFLSNGQYATAFYNNKGELLAVTRNISTLQLPVVLLADLKKECSTQWVSELFEVSNDAGTTYYVTLEDANGKTILKSNGTNWLAYQKVRK